MSKISDWMIEMDEQISTAIELGATSVEQVVCFARTNLPLVDDKYIEREILKIMGPEENQ